MLNNLKVMIWSAAEGQSGNQVRHFASLCKMTWMACNISNSIWNSVVDSSGCWEHIFLTLDQSPSPSLSTDIKQFLCHSIPLPPLKSSVLFLRKLKPSADFISKDLHPNSWLIWPRVGLCSQMGVLASITCDLDSIPCVPRTSQSLH